MIGQCILYGLTTPDYSKGIKPESPMGTLIWIIGTLHRQCDEIEGQGLALHHPDWTDELLQRVCETRGLGDYLHPPR
jgi:hypothetical protein